MNIIDAVINLVNNAITEAVDYNQGRNRANNAGKGLEEFVKDLFANTFNLDSEQRLKIQRDVFSYFGNNSNPPDAMLRNGDAIEVKKIESDNSQLQLNSSYPKHKFNKDNPMISNACKKSEDWEEKDIIYITGVIKQKSTIIKHLCMVYGTEYCASEECYIKIRDLIKDGIKSTEGVNFAESKELGRINKVDPLGITNLRIRGMWLIDNPWKAFDYIYQRDNSKKFNFMCIISTEKWNSFENRNDLLDLSNRIERLNISDKQVKNPDNPAQLIDVKLITFDI